MRCQTIGCRETAVWTWHVADEDVRFVAAVCHEHLERVTPVDGTDRCGVTGCDRGASAVAVLRPSARTRHLVPVALCYSHARDASGQYADEISWLDTVEPPAPVGARQG